MTSIFLYLFLFSVTWLPGQKFQIQNGSLTVAMANFQNDQGSVSVTLFNKEETYPGSPEKAVLTIRSTISNKRAVVVFQHLTPGEYAVSAYHDENDNKKMDTNWFGKPKEGVGNSNNARGHFGPPKYRDAKFNFNGGNQSISFNIIYL